MSSPLNDFDLILNFAMRHSNYDFDADKPLVEQFDISTENRYFDDFVDYLVEE